MMEVEIDKSATEGNGYATGGKIIFGNKEASIPFKSTSIAKTNTTEYDILDRYN